MITLGDAGLNLSESIAFETADIETESACDIEGRSAFITSFSHNCVSEVGSSGLILPYMRAIGSSLE